MKHTITILGDGSWGTAVATLCAANGYDVTLWCYNDAVAHDIATNRENSRFLPGFILSEHITPTTDLHRAIKQATHIFEAIPIKYLRSVLEKGASAAHASQSWISLSKGIEKDTLKLSSQIITDIVSADTPLAVVAGPSFAREVAQQQPTGMMVASTHSMLADTVTAFLTTNFCTVFPSNDITGIELGGALKNIYALGAGLLDGAGYGTNTQALFITRSLNELEQLYQSVGGSQESLYGLAGLGDLILTCTSEQSRNYQTGKACGQGQSIASYLREQSFVPEGINTIQSIRELVQKHNLQLPIITALAAIIDDTAPIDTLITTLLQSPE